MLNTAGYFLKCPTELLELPVVKRPAAGRAGVVMVLNLIINVILSEQGVQ